MEQRKDTAKLASCKWKKHYDALMEKARHREMSGYIEKHHVIPRCMGGQDNNENLVKLTPEEHYVAHQMLLKMYPQHSGIIKSAGALLMTSPNTPRKNKMYGWIRRRLAEHMSEVMIERHKHVPHPMLGRKQSDSAKRRISESQRAKQKKTVYCFNSDGSLHKIYSSVLKASQAINLHVQTIYSCIRTDGARSAGGFFWAYRNQINVAEMKNGKVRIKHIKKRFGKWQSGMVKSASAIESWKRADEIFELMMNDSQLSCGQISLLLGFEKHQAVKGPYLAIKSGWNPLNDPQWVEWKMK
jgi:hypothetical protein